MAASNHSHLSRRERQIMNIIYTRGQASVGEVRADMADPPSYSSVRALMRILEEKAHLKHRSQGVKYMYTPTRPRRAAARSALKQLLTTFFDNSAANAVAALLEVSDAKLTKQELARVRKLIDQAKKTAR